MVLRYYLVYLKNKEEGMSNVRYSTCTMIGLAVLLAFIPSGSALAQDESAKALGLNADFTYSPAIPVVGQPAQFTDASDGGPIFWEWEFDDGTTSNLRNPTHIFNDSGDFEVELTVWDSSGDKDDEIRSVEVLGLEEPNASFIWSPGLPSIGQEVKFTDTSEGFPTSWEWDFDDGGSSTAQNPMHTFFEAGVYEVKLTVSNSGGQDDEIIQVTVSADVQSPEASFFFLPMEPTVGEVVRFFDTSGGGSADSWEWDFDDGSGSNKQFAEHTFAVEGDYNVSLTVTNSAGETSTEKTVDVKDEIDPGSPCEQDLAGGVVCLRDGRFEITATWTDFSDPPVEQPLIWTPVEDINATGGFQNNPSGIQIVMRIADGCENTGTWWVWLGGFTDAGWDITVRDTVTGLTRPFTKPRQGGVFPTTERDSTTFSCN
jgi:PKD repeat protein